MYDQSRFLIFFLIFPQPFYSELFHLIFPPFPKKETKSPKSYRGDDYAQGKETLPSVLMT